MSLLGVMFIINGLVRMLIGTEEIILETASSSLSERGATRLDDQTNEASMERRKKEGYF